MPLKCLQCGCHKTRVIDSGADAESVSIRRRRACNACGYRFTTYEQASVPGREVEKLDGRIEPFDDQKLLRSLERACSGLLTGDDIMAVAAAAKSCFSEKVRVTSEELRDVVANQLKMLAPAAYIRYRLDECVDPADMMVVVAAAIRE